MGKGDKKSKRGKIILGSFGVRRRKKAKKSIIAPSAKDASMAGVTPGAAASPVVEETRTVKQARPKVTAKTAAKPAARKTEKESDASGEKAPEAGAGKVAKKITKPAAGTRKKTTPKEE